MKIPIAREGCPFILISAAFTAVVLVFGFKSIALLFGLLCVAFTGFFRDPERVPPPGDGWVLSPADGKVVAVEKEPAGNASGVGETRVSIFMSPLDVHVNRAPIGGNVIKRTYSPGKFVAAYKEKASIENERNALTMLDREGRAFRVVQIAGVLARRIVCYVKEGDSLRLGQRLGIIMFGSRVDLFLPASVRVEISKGDRVKAGQSVIGKLS